MTKRELIELMQPLADGAEVVVFSEQEDRYLPCKGKLGTRGMEVVCALEPLSFVERGGEGI